MFNREQDERIVKALERAADAMEHVAELFESYAAVVERKITPPKETIELKDFDDIPFKT